MKLNALLENQVAIVTGAASGIGLAIARALLESGAAVLLADVDIEAAAHQAEIFKARGLRAHGQRVDVTKACDANAAVAAAESLWGPVDILVNNAGVGSAGTVLTTTEEEWDRIMSINVKGIYWMARAALPTMIARRIGCIVNIASAAGVVGVRDRAAYSASKGAVMALTRAMQADLIVHGIRVNAVLPGTVASPWVERITADQPDPQATRNQMAARQPIGRMGTPEEIAWAVLYLVSPGASFSWGSHLIVDGGLTAF